MGRLRYKRGGLEPRDVADRVTNGTFDADTDWVKGVGWTIAGNVATHAGGVGSNLDQVIASQASGGLELGVDYNTSFDVDNRTAGSVRIYVGGSSAGTLRSGNTTYTQRLICSGNTTIFISCTATFDGDIDNVIVTRAGQ